MFNLPLNNKDYNRIMDSAMNKYITENIERGDNSFLCKCYISSFLEFLKINTNYSIINGELVDKSKN